jgi:enolase
MAEDGALRVPMDKLDEALSVCSDAIQSAGFRLREDYSLGIDVGGPGLFDAATNKYEIEEKKGCRTTEELFALLGKLLDSYPVSWIQDAFRHTVRARSSAWVDADVGRRMQIFGRA